MANESDREASSENNNNIIALALSLVVAVVVVVKLIAAPVQRPLCNLLNFLHLNIHFGRTRPDGHNRRPIIWSVVNQKIARVSL